MMTDSLIRYFVRGIGTNGFLLVLLFCGLGIALTYGIDLIYRKVTRKKQGNARN
jgi:hypothetical protein